MLCGVVDGVQSGQAAAWAARPQLVLNQAQCRQHGWEGQLVVFSADRAISTQHWVDLAGHSGVARVCYLHMNMQYNHSTPVKPVKTQLNIVTMTMCVSTVMKIILCEVEERELTMSTVWAPSSASLTTAGFGSESWVFWLSP